MLSRKKHIIAILLILLLITGCSKKNSYGIDVSKYDTKGLEVTKCVREAETDDDSKVNMNYLLYSDKEGYVKVLISTEEIKSKDSKVLDKYEKAYKNVFSVYKDIEYYENVIKRTNDKMISKTYINYGRVDMDRIIKIEGTEDNVELTNGKIKLKNWKSWAKKYGGVMCK